MNIMSLKKVSKAEKVRGKSLVFMVHFERLIIV